MTPWVLTSYLLVMWREVDVPWDQPQGSWMKWINIVHRCDVQRQKQGIPGYAW